MTSWQVFYFLHLFLPFLLFIENYTSLNLPAYKPVQYDQLFHGEWGLSWPKSVANHIFTQKSDPFKKRFDQKHGLHIDLTYGMSWRSSCRADIKYNAATSREVQKDFNSTASSSQM